MIAGRGEMIEDGRSGVVILLSHCILNTNSVCHGSAAPARHPAMIDEVIEILRRLRIGVLQLPCPEQAAFGLDRRCMEKKDVVTPGFKARCAALARAVADLVGEYVEKGYRVSGFVGRRGSPSCSVDEDPARGVFTQEIEKAFEKAGWDIPLLQFDWRDVGALVSKIEKLNVGQNASPSQGRLP